MSFAWCTLVMGVGKNPSGYAAGCVALQESLKRSRSIYPLVVMCAGDLSMKFEHPNLSEHPNLTESTLTVREYLEQYCTCVDVPLIQHETCRMPSVKQEKIYREWIDYSFTKWNCFLLPYAKVCFLDADSIVLSNIDSIMQLSTPAATFSNPWAPPYNITAGLYNPFGELPHGSTVQPVSILLGLQPPITIGTKIKNKIAKPQIAKLIPATKDRKTLRQYKRPEHVNGIVAPGCMVLVEPAQASYDMMIKILGDKPYGHPNCINGADEQVLNEVFVHLAASGHTITHIHQSYNWIVGKNNWLCGETAKAMQWYNEKPWDQGRDSTWPDVAVWFKYFDNAQIKTI